MLRPRSAAALAAQGQHRPGQASQQTVPTKQLLERYERWDGGATIAAGRLCLRTAAVVAPLTVSGNSLAPPRPQVRQGAGEAAAAGGPQGRATAPDGGRRERRVRRTPELCTVRLGGGARGLPRPGGAAHHRYAGLAHARGGGGPGPLAGSEWRPGAWCRTGQLQAAPALSARRRRWHRPPTAHPRACRPDPAQAATTVGNRLAGADRERQRALDAAQIISHLQAFAHAKEPGALPPLFHDASRSGEAAALTSRLLALASELVRQQEREAGGGGGGRRSLPEPVRGRGAAATGGRGCGAGVSAAPGRPKHMRGSRELCSTVHDIRRSGRRSLRAPWSTRWSSWSCTARCWTTASSRASMRRWRGRTCVPWQASAGRRAGARLSACLPACSEHLRLRCLSARALHCCLGRGAVWRTGRRSQLPLYFCAAPCLQTARQPWPSSNEGKQCWCRCAGLRGWLPALPQAAGARSGCVPRPAGRGLSAARAPAATALHLHAAHLQDLGGPPGRSRQCRCRRGQRCWQRRSREPRRWQQQ